MAEQFKYQPEWQGPLSGRSFEKQTEDAINGLWSYIENMPGGGGGALPSDSLPLSPGTASAGSSAKYARGDHRHPPQSSLSGNAATATKLQTPRSIALTGAVEGEGYFDGSVNVSIDTAIATATTSTAGLMSAADKAKLNGIAAGATAVTVDSALSQSSANPVRNSAVYAALALKLDTSATITNAQIDALFA